MRSGRTLHELIVEAGERYLRALKALRAAEPAGAEAALVTAITVAVEGSFQELRRSVRKTLVLVWTGRHRRGV